MEKIKNKIRNNKIVATVIGVVLVFIIWYAIAHRGGTAYMFVTVGQGPITESVSVTGNTTPSSSVSLGFGNSGTVAQVYSAVGKPVTSGQLLAQLNTSDLYAQIKQAQSTVATQEANYQKVLNGATGSAIDVAKTALSTAQSNLEQVTKQQDLLVANAKRNFLNSTLAFKSVGGSTLTPPTLSGTYTKDAEGTISLYVNQTGNGGYVSFSGIANGVTPVDATVAEPLADTGLFVQFPSMGLSTYAGTNWVIDIPNTTAVNYLSNYNAYQSALQTKSQSVAAAQGALDQARASLAQTTSTARPEDIAAAQAQVDSAQAGVQSIEAKLENSRIVAPISGVITQFDAKVGQFATPGTTLISIISASSFEVDALVSETDVGKVALNNTVSMTLDAFPGETFTGSVFYIDPAQTSTEGVVGYKIKVAFDKTDPRLKSGLTASIDISTRHKDSVLILPQYAILQNDAGTFVEVLQNGKVVDVPVTLGLQDEKGNVEIVSGVTEAEQVINIGLKK